MKIRIHDIPVGGRQFDFELEDSTINQRVGSANDLVVVDGEKVHAPDYKFNRPPKARLFIELEGSTLNVNGEVSATYSTVCARCAEPTLKEMNVPIHIILKPMPEKARPDEIDEDLQFGFYRGAELDLVPIVEEFLILALPFTVLCREDCLGLCQSCGINLNLKTCTCVQVEEGDERWAALKQIKIH